MGERNAGNPHVAFDVEEAGNVARPAYFGLARAPVLDPTCERPEVQFLRPTHHCSHYIRDSSFAEDASRIRCNPGIFARLRSFAANILRFNGVRNVADGRHRIAFGGIRAILGMRVMY